jgi:fluoride ion exporter CrcB/FEX
MPVSAPQNLDRPFETEVTTTPPDVVLEPLSLSHPGIDTEIQDSSDDEQQRNNTRDASLHDTVVSMTTHATSASHKRDALTPSPTPAIQVNTTTINSTINLHALSEHSDGGGRDLQQQQEQSSPIRLSPGGRKAIHDFFYPPRQQSKSKLGTDSDSIHPKAKEGEYASRLDDVTPRHRNPLPKHPSRAPLPDTLQPPFLSQDMSTESVLKQPTQHDQRQEQFQNQDSDGQDTRSATNATLATAPRPTSDCDDTLHRSNGGNTNEPTPAHVVEEQQDKAFIEKFWTSYDEILILSLFTQVGILCRLGAASFFRYFDSVFHSGSALFTNLPLNCLSCFVMGILCSGESLMQIINTRFTPPRLQQDLHREASQQYQEGDIQQHPSLALMEDYSSEEDMVEMETAGATRRRQRRRRRRKRSRPGWQSRRPRTSSLLHKHGQNRESEVLQELREVQLLAWERRIRASVCLLLFPVRQEDVDVVENYFSEGYRVEGHDRSQSGYQEGNSLELVQERHGDDRVSLQSGEYSSRGMFVHNDLGDFDDLMLVEEDDDEETPGNLHGDHNGSSRRFSNEKPCVYPNQSKIPPSQSSSKPTNGESQAPNLPLQSNASDAPSTGGHVHARGTPHIRSRQYTQVEGGNVVDYGTQNNPDLDQFISTVANDVSKNISRIGRVNLAEGWDVGTSPQEKSEDLCLGLRDGLCGALSSFSSWISSMVNLFRTGEIGQAIVGLMLGIQLPLLAYRFGQHVSVYIFVWRCRREKRRDERRGGYGIRLQMDEDGSCDEELVERSIHSHDTAEEVSASASHRTSNNGRTKGIRTVHDEESEVPSVRAIITALFIMCLVAQLTSLNFFYEPKSRLLALSLLFSPLGVLARWRMMKFNTWRPSFPLGTFAW